MARIPRNTRSPRGLLSFAALALAGLSLSASAATWIGGDNFWSNPANWSPTGEPTLADDALFGTPVPLTGDAITLSAGETAFSLTFRDFYSLTGGSLALGGTGRVTIAPSISVRIRSSLIGSNGLTLAASNGLGGADAQAGGGTLTLTGTNTYTGGTTIAAGTLRFGRDASLGAAGTGITLSGGTLSGAYSYLGARTVTVTGTASKIDIARNGTTTYSTFDANFAGAAGTKLTKTGIGNLFLRSASSFAGDFEIDFNAGWAGQSIPANFAGTQLRDNGSLANISSLTIGQSSTLSLENDQGLATAGVNRINDSAPVFLKGGTLHFHTKAALVNDETIGATTLVSGMSSLVTQSQNAGSAARLFVTWKSRPEHGRDARFAGLSTRRDRG